MPQVLLRADTIFELMKYSLFSKYVSKEEKQMGIEIIKGAPGVISGTSAHRKINDSNALKADAVSPMEEKSRNPDIDPREKEDVNEAIEKLKHAGEIFNRRLDFRVDEETNRVVVKVVDTTTDKVIKEIPSEQLLQLAAKIQEMIGILVDEER
jgi:flagellar protein FlaG